MPRQCAYLHSFLDGIFGDPGDPGDPAFTHAPIYLVERGYQGTIIPAEKENLTVHFNYSLCFDKCISC